jgi:hypothetical protein
MYQGCGSVRPKSKFKVLWDLVKREAPVQEGSGKYEVFQEEGTQRAGPLRPSYFLHKSFVSGIYYVMIREL